MRLMRRSTSVSLLSLFLTLPVLASPMQDAPIAPAIFPLTLLAEAEQTAVGGANPEAEATAKAAAEEEARRQAQAESAARAEQNAANRAAEEQARRQAEAEAAARAEQSAANRAAEEQARRQAEAEAATRAEQEAASRAAEEQARGQAEAEAAARAEQNAANRAAEEQTQGRAETVTKTEGESLAPTKQAESGEAPTRTAPNPPPVAAEPDATNAQTSAPEPAAAPESPALSTPPRQRQHPGREGNAPSMPSPSEPAPTPEPSSTLASENPAPILDSAKETASEPRPEIATQRQRPAREAAANAPPTADDLSAQTQMGSAPPRSSRAERGERQGSGRQSQRPGQAQSLGGTGNRRIFSVDRSNIVETPDTARIARQSDEVIVERLPGNRTRETIIRPNGDEIVTIYNRWGDIIQRSRILPDGREVFLSYGHRSEEKEENAWRDPGRNLPPLRLAVSAGDYVLDAERVEDEREFYGFLKKPPVERIERPYSLNEVKRSARLRDKVRRIEMSNLPFASGSAEIPERQIDRLAGLASAILMLLEKNPAETFLIEGHTDAMGPEVENLALSDRRAENLAVVLSDVFGIPPENLATQGYGERFLRIGTDGPEPLNRRIVFRRITPLILPLQEGDPRAGRTQRER